MPHTPDVRTINDMTRPDDTDRRIGQRSDEGYSFAELLVSVVLVGVLATIVSATVHNVTTEAAVTGCEQDGRVIVAAVTSYLALSNADVIAPTGDDGDRYERTLVETGHLRTPSTYYDLAADGTLTPLEDSPC